MRNFGVDDLHRFRSFVSVPMLSASIDDSADPALQNEPGPGVGGKAHPAAFLSRRSFGHDENATAVVITTEKKNE